MAANLTNKIEGMYKSGFAKAFLNSSKKLVMDEETLNWLVDSTSATISYEAEDGLIRESDMPSATELVGLFTSIGAFDLTEAKNKAIVIVEHMAEITLLAESTMQTKFPTLYKDREAYAKYLHDEINSLDRKDWVDFLAGNYGYVEA